MAIVRLSDAELVEGALAGDPRAFPELVKRHGTGLYGYLRHRLGSEADDAYAEVWMKVWERLGRYEDRGRFGAWLFTIAHRLFLDKARRAGRRPQEPLEEEGGEERFASPEPGPEREAEASAARERIGAALGKLPEDQREVFLLREFGGLSFAEIADAMDCPLSTALARMRYAVLKLRGELGDLRA